MTPILLSSQTAYSDLLQRLQKDAILETGRHPHLRCVKGKDYWYVRTYVGTREKAKYLGPDTPELRAQVEAMRQTNEDARDRQKRRQGLVKALQTLNIPRIDAASGKVIQALARAGVFRLRSVLVGTHAYRLYPLILGVELPEAHHLTEDIDVAQFHEISVALDDHVDPSLEDALKQVGDVAAIASLDDRKPTGYFVADTPVELLTPNRGAERDSPLELPALGLHATPLRFLDFLIADAIPAAVPYRYGVLVNVPQPARYAVHKLIVATRRTKSSAAKASKDIAQARSLIEVLSEERPDELAEAYLEAGQRGESWQKALKRGAARLPKAAQSRLAEVVREAG